MYRFSLKNSVTLLIILLFLTFGVSDSIAWNSFLGDSGHSLKTTDNLSDYFSLDYRIDLGTSFLSSPVIDNNLIFAGGKNGILYAIDIDTQQIKWFYRTSGPILSTPCVNGNFIYFGSNDGKFYSLRKEDGFVNFIFNAESPVASSPAADNNNVIFATSLTNKLISLNPLTGVKNWEYNLTQPSQSSPMILSDKVYTGVNNGKLICVDLNSGIEIFNFQTTGNPGFHSPCPLDSNTILFAPGILDKNLYAISSLTGNELWRYSGSINPNASPAIPRKRVGLSHLARLPQLRKIDENVENKRNFFPDAEQSFFIAPIDPNLVYSSTGIATDDENIYTVTGYPEAYLVAVSKITHEFNWKQSLGIFSETVGFYTTPITNNNRVYITNSNGEFIVLDKTNGTKISSLYISSYLYSTPAIRNNKIILCTKKGSIIVLKEKPVPTGNDVIPPQITDVTPVSGTTIITDKPVFSARFVEDESGILYSKIKFKINGIDKPFTFNAVNSTIRYTPYYPLANGLYTVFIEVEDGSGNSKNHVWSFTINSSIDTIAPILSILTPSNNETVTDTSFPEISVHISETGGSGLSLSDISMMIDSEFVPYLYNEVSSLITFSPEFPLSNGEHQISINASDKAGNAAVPLKWKFSIQLSGDSTPPKIIPVFPLEDSIVKTTKKPEIKIKLEDVSRLNKSSISLKLDNEITAYNFDESSGILKFTPADYLENGNHTIKISVLDLPGNLGTKSWSFNIQLDLKPVLTRMTNVISDSCSINWLTNPESIGSIKLSQNPDMSLSEIHYDSRGDDFKTVFHSVKLESLTDGETLYFQIINEAEGSSLTSTEIFEFTSSGSVSLKTNIIEGKLVKEDNEIENAIVFLTVETKGSFSRPLSVFTDINGDFEFSANKILSASGTEFSITNESILRISAYDNKDSSAFSSFLVTDFSSNINIGEINLSSTIKYRYKLKYGLNPVSVFLKNTATMTAFNLLDNNDEIKEIFRFNSVTNLYSSATRLFGESVGNDFLISPNEGLFMNVKEECEIDVIGSFSDENDSINLIKGLNLVGIPGGNELPDNPVSKFNSKEFLENNNNINVISSFNIEKQLFESFFVYDDVLMGDEFDLRHDKAYFISAINSSTLNDLAVKNLTPVKYSPINMRKSPSRMISNKTELKKFNKMIFPPNLITGRILNNGAGLENIDLNISLVKENNFSEKHSIKTNKDGYYFFNMANFQNFEFKGNFEELKFFVEFKFMNKSFKFKRNIDNKNLIILNNYLLEEVMD